MMLWFKAWRESRVRFLMSAGVLAFMCLSSIYRARNGFPPPERPDLPYSAWVWANIYGNLNPTVFVILAMILGLGGLQRERPVGTAPFTLSLPVTRLRLTAIRAATGTLQVILLALIPSMIVPALSPLVAGQSYPVFQTLQFALLFMTWGTVAFAAGFLLSSLFAGEFTGAALCVIVPVLYRILLQSSAAVAGYPAANYASFMSGLPYISSPVSVTISAALPWMSFVTLAVVSMIFFACAAARTNRQDF